MSHAPLQLTDITLSLPHKTCFQDFSAHIPSGSRIAIIGRNGSGKSTLLRMLGRLTTPTNGTVQLPEDARCGYVPQIISDFDTCSGGERLNAALTRALSQAPNVLLLDEPTNHLDQDHRRNLLRMLRRYTGTLIVVSHDTALLRSCIDTLWHIDAGQIHTFSGNYDDYMRARAIAHARLVQASQRLDQQKHETHLQRMKEQQRAAQSKSKGEKNRKQNKWAPVVGNAKAASAEATSGRKRAALDAKQQDIATQRALLQPAEVIRPTFTIPAGAASTRRIVQIHAGSVAYAPGAPLLAQITFAVDARQRVALHGPNGSGKSTLVQAILGNNAVVKTGEWCLPKREEIGYLDQHYHTLETHKTVIDALHDCVPAWSHAEVRRHLNDFLFRKNEEVNAPVAHLSGGEKARLCLAQIAARPPALLILDEVTNNLDLETRAHVISVLQDYPGALLMISHDIEFQEAVNIQVHYSIVRGILQHSHTP